MIESGSEYVLQFDGQKINVAENIPVNCQKAPNILTISENNLE